MIYVLTSNLNGWDNLRPPLDTALQASVRWICFTNNPHQPACPPWEFRPIYDVGEPCRTARVPKILPHLMLPDDAEYSIWQDGNFQLRMTPSAIIGHTLQRHDWAAHQHPGRACCYREGEHCIEQRIGTPERIRAELNRYLDSKHPVDAGLWACGIIVRRHTTSSAALSERWWELYAQGGERDQISFPVARRGLNMAIHTIPASVFDSPFAVHNFHAAWTHRSNNVAYTAERQGMRDKLARLQAVTGKDGGLRWPET